MRGFTLIELLAVIVILAIILVIAVPMISNVIESAKMSSFASSTELVKEAAELEYSVASLKGEEEAIKFTFTDGVQTSTIGGRLLKINGEAPKNGNVMVDNKGVVTYTLHNGKYCSYTDLVSDEVKTEEMTLAECSAKIFVCGNDLLDSRDGKTYRTIEIDSKCWLKDNLAYVNATCLTNAWNATAPHDACRTHVYNTKTEVLYQWDTIMNGNTAEGTQGICPAGWHIPSDNEYKELEIFYGMSQAVADTVDWRGTNQGTLLKDPTGFNLYLPGYRITTSAISDVGGNGSMWSSTSLGTTAWTRSAHSSLATSYRAANPLAGGFPVRCVK